MVKWDRMNTIIQIASSTRLCLLTEEFNSFPKTLQLFLRKENVLVATCYLCGCKKRIHVLIIQTTSQSTSSLSQLLIPFVQIAQSFHSLSYWELGSSLNCILMFSLGPFNSIIWVQNHRRSFMKMIPSAFGSIFLYWSWIQKTSQSTNTLLSLYSFQLSFFFCATAINNRQKPTLSLLLQLKSQRLHSYRLMQIDQGRDKRKCHLISFRQSSSTSFSPAKIFCYTYNNNIGCVLLGPGWD